MNTDIRLISANNTYNKDASGLPKPAVETTLNKNEIRETNTQSVTKSLHYHSSSQTTPLSSETTTTSLYGASYRFSSSTSLSNDIIHKELQSKLSAFDSSNITRGLHRFDPMQFSPISPPSPPSPEEVSKKVLGFIENKIKLEASQGASNERIESLISQARSGFEKGFEQATDQIEQLGLLNHTLSEEIDVSYTSIHQGLDRILSTYTQGTNRQEASRPAEEAQVSTEQPKLTTTEEPKFVFPTNQQTSTSAYQHSYAYSESTAIQIKTQDGDIISINLSQLYASLKEGSQFSSSNVNNSNNQSYDFQGNYHSAQYQYSIEGTLDEGETQALTDLLLQIESLAEEFFSGDFQGAFESALALGFDASEIASFSVNLNMTQVEQISTYESISNVTPQHDKASSPLSLLSNFADRFTSLNENILEHFKSSEHMITNLLSSMVEDRFDSKTEENINTNSADNTFSPLTDNLKTYLTQLLNSI